MNEIDGLTMPIEVLVTIITATVYGAFALTDMWLYPKELRITLRKVKAYTKKMHRAEKHITSKKGSPNPILINVAETSLIEGFKITQQWHEHSVLCLDVDNMDALAKIHAPYKCHAQRVLHKFYCAQMGYRSALLHTRYGGNYEHV